MTLLEGVGLGGGLVALFSGAALNAVGWVEGASAAAHLFVAWGMALLFVAVPLLILGAHCLDMEERRARRARNRAARARGGDAADATEHEPHSQPGAWR
jgi:hypothetical protein